MRGRKQGIHYRSRGGCMRMKMGIKWQGKWRRLGVAGEKNCGYSYRCVGKVATSPAFPKLHKARQNTGGEKKNGESVRTDGESNDGWLVDGWTTLNATISQWINGPWWGGVRGCVLTQDFVCRCCQQSTQPCLFVSRSGCWEEGEGGETKITEHRNRLSTRPGDLTQLHSVWDLQVLAFWDITFKFLCSDNFRYSR